MKIALVANTSWSVYNFRLEVCRYLQSKGAQIYILAPRDKHSEKLIAEGFHFINAPLKAYSHNPFDDIRYLQFLFRKYQYYKFQYVFHYTIKANIYGSIASRLAGIQSVLVVTGLGRFLHMEDGFLKWITSKLYKLGCYCSNDIWFLNSADREFFLDKNFASKRKVFLLNSEGVNLEKFSNKNHKKANSNRFLFAGRLLIEKGILHYLEAAKQIKRHYPNSIFEIVGFLDPEDSQCIDSLLLQKYQDSGIITFMGDTENIAPFLEKTDCLVLPSYYGEGVSRVLLEAAAMCLPTITTANRGCSDVVIDGYNGFLCKKQGAESLAEQIMAFISLDTEAREILGKNGRRLVGEKYDVNDICKVYSDYIFGLKTSTLNSRVPQEFV